jgi:hypothetical protein
MAAEQRITDRAHAIHLIKHGGLAVRVAKPQLVRRGFLERLADRPFVARVDHCPIGPEGCVRQGNELWVGRALYEEVMADLRGRVAAQTGVRFKLTDRLLSFIPHR